MSTDRAAGPTTEERHTKQLRMLPDGDADDIEHPDERGRTRLHRAVNHGAEHAVAALLDAGAEVNSRDEWGNTPLWLAIYHHDHGATIVADLLQRNADPSIENHQGVSALQLAEALAEDNTEIAALLPRLCNTGTAATGDDAER